MFELVAPTIILVISIIDLYMIDKIYYGAKALAVLGRAGDQVLREIYSEKTLCMTHFIIFEKIKATSRKLRVLSYIVLIMTVSIPVFFVITYILYLEKILSIYIFLGAYAVLLYLIIDIIKGVWQVRALFRNVETYSDKTLKILKEILKKRMREEKHYNSSTTSNK